MIKKETKLIKLRIMSVVAFIVILCGALAAIMSWVIVFKPFEKFEHYKEQLIFGDSFDIEGVNIVRIGDSIGPYRFELRYEVNGITYVKYWKVWGGYNEIGRFAEFDYLISDPNYTVQNRTLALIMLPVTFVVLCLVEALIIKAYLKERERFRKYEYKAW